jgi:hypothetical protein
MKLIGWAPQRFGFTVSARNVVATVMAERWEYLDRLCEAEGALAIELRNHPQSIVAMINLAYVRKMRRKFEPANDDRDFAAK